MLSEEAVRKVARLSRLAIDESQIPRYADQLSSILQHIERIQELDVEGVEPMAHPLPLNNRLDDDVPTEGIIAKTHSFTVLPGMLYPASRGTVRLASADPAAHPLIDPNYLAEEQDMATMVRGIQLTREIAAAAPLSSYLRGEAFPGSGCGTVDDIRAHVRRSAKTIFHPVGTCKMGIESDSVVDPSLRVRGVQGLRVADASIMPTIVGGNTNAPSIMIGEKCSDLLRTRYGYRQLGREHSSH